VRQAAPGRDRRRHALRGRLRGGRAAARGSGDRPGADFGDAFADVVPPVCADWPRGACRADFYKLAPAPAATLVLSGGSIPRRRRATARASAAALGAKARHVVVPNAGHGVMALGCMRDVLFRFIDADSDDEALRSTPAASPRSRARACRAGAAGVGSAR
jgi:hypothetical protein